MFYHVNVPLVNDKSEFWWKSITRPVEPYFANQMMSQEKRRRYNSLAHETIGLVFQVFRFLKDLLMATAETFSNEYNSTYGASPDPILLAN